MERESFEDDEVAEILNEYFISIKVDREERPDLDSIYMTFCQALTGHGGWPMTIFMTPDKKPFYAGTYFPKRSKHGYPGLIEILNKIKDSWRLKKEDIVKESHEIVESVNTFAKHNVREGLSKEDIIDVFESFKEMFDEVHGGFGTRPKFPTPHNLLFLLRYWKVFGEKKALDMVQKTLDGMYKGGIFDHIGFGFSRYSTDEKWLVPHFEKMLYDNALLAITYAESYQATNKRLYKKIAKNVLDYIIRDMTSEEDGFYSAEDADSEGVEGKFYVWPSDEIKNILGKSDGDVYCKYYDITEYGNFEGMNIPNLIEEDIEQLDNDLELSNKLDVLREKLFRYREKRVHPHKDDKVLTSWNGLMIAAMAIVGRVLDDDIYTNKAKMAWRFISHKLIRKDGRLLARYRDNESAYLAYLDDYAFLIWGLIELYETTFDVEYLKRALSLNEDMIRLFWDDNEGGFYLYGEDSEQLIMRPKDIYDGAIPSGNSIAALNMLKLFKLTGDKDLEKRVENMFEIFGNKVKANLISHSYFMISLLFSSTPNKEITIAGDRHEETTIDMINEINKRFLPFTTVLLNDEGQDIYEIAPFIKEQKEIDNKPTAYVCEGFACNMPVTDKEKLIKLLKDRN